MHECLFVCLTSKPENLLGHLNFVGVLWLASLAYSRSAPAKSAYYAKYQCFRSNYGLRFSNEMKQYEPASMCLLYVFLVKFQAMKVLEVTDE